MPDSGDVDLERLKGMSILLAEDNVTNQLVATQMLETLGAEVDLASDGAMALERLKVRTYDVLLIDIEMPRVSGLDVIRSIRADREPLASATVIALTAYAMEEHREKMISAGADGLIPKPILSINKFGEEILRFLDAHGGRAKGPAPQGAASAALIERSLYESFAASLGPEAMESILTRVDTDMTAQRAELRTGKDSADAGRLESASHILVSLAGMIGAVRLQGQAERLNALAREGDMERASELAGEALTEIEGVLAFVRAEREALEA